jgi:hypothetical protein
MAEFTGQVQEGKIMKKGVCLLFLVPFLIVLCGANCAGVQCTGTETKEIEETVKMESKSHVLDDAAVALEKNPEDRPDPGVSARENGGDYEALIRNFTGQEKVVKVFPSTGRMWELIEKVKGSGTPSTEKNPSGRQYFGYMSILRPKPLTSADHSIDTIFLKDQIKGGHTLTLRLDISAGGGEMAEGSVLKKYVFKVTRGFTIRNYLQEGTLGYIVQKEDGAYAYGQYIVGSAVIIPDKEDSDLSSLVEEYLQKEGTPDIPALIDILGALNEIQPEE